ncbi:Transposon TX1 uncharacterized 82 kDa protein ORF 1 [Takifugu flavidus]|uniref:Transposon TX1 uncharacterized 82 kDa protein ORF 1 n=1 Tax=Takifugu flavidus TaxID=433684 RepID=A0A5C6PH93_9TELE|nr:Transposon TX1 uncharacterized 82 kDa protein ORF 1 [Takifugu flavidus]
MAAEPGTSELEKLTRRHGVKLSPPDGVSVEECALAVGDIVGHTSVKSASRMNKMVVVFVGSTDKADQLVAAGVAIKGEHTPMFPLSNPAKSVVVSNVPLFIKNEMLLRELSRHGRIVSPMRFFALGAKSLLLRHVVSFRRHVVMVLNNNEKELDLALCFRVDGPPASRPACQRSAHDEDREAAQTTQGDMGPTAEVEEPAGPQGDHPGDHRDLQNERLTGEMVERTVPRTAETVRDMEDVGVEESSLSVPTKRKSKDTKVNNDKDTHSPQDTHSLQDTHSSQDMHGTPMDTQSTQTSLVDTQEASGHSDDVKVEVRPGYHLEKIKWFLRVTKGQRSVQVEDHFPDLQLFHDRVRMFMRMERYGEPAFTDREMYRLKKMLIKIRSQLC